MRRMAATHAGTYYHRAALEERAPMRDVDIRLIDAPGLARADLRGLDLLILTDRTPAVHIRRAAPRLLSFARKGGRLIVFGENGDYGWIPGLRWTHRPTNYWWWLTGDDQGLRIDAPDHSLFAFLGVADLTWHFHGTFAPPPGARRLVSVPGRDGGRDDGREALMVDIPLGAGSILATTLDPFYHHGSYFMPATTRFLEGFARWLKADPPVHAASA